MVKRLFSIFLLSLAVLGAKAQYQFPNSTFDGDFISSYGSYTEPQGWHGYATIDASSLNSAGRTGDKLQQYTSVRSGASGKCVGVHSTSILGVVANGVLTNGQIYTHSTTATDGSQNYNFSDPTNTGNSSTYGANNQFYTTFTGRPDYVKVWVKFAPAKSGTGNARCSMILHKAGTKMYDPEDNVSDKSIVVARAATAITSGDWQQLRIPFTYVSTSDPGLILATFTTNETPGGGSADDYLYVDDIEMEYVSELINPTYNGSAITFDANGDASIEAAYNSKMLKYTTGAGATVETSMGDDYKLTIKITGNNVSVDPTNVHTYTIQFTGIASGNDDEADVKVTPETKASLTPQTLATGSSYYLYNIKQGVFADHSSTLSSTPQRYWTISSSKVTDSDSHAIQVNRTGSWSDYTSLDYSHFPITSVDDNSYTMVFSQSNGILKMYRNVGAYYTSGLFGIKTQQNADIYVGANSATSYYAYSSDAEEAQWYLYDIQQTDRVYGFWQNYSSASTSNGVDASDFVYDGQTVSNLPLGIYVITGSGSLTVEGGSTYTSSNGTFYIPNGGKVSFSGTPTLTYYGRLDFSLDATYDGTKLSNGSSIDDVYDASKLTVNLTGNGSETSETFFDEDTYQLTIYIKGYGRSKEYTIQFAEPDLSLSATWYGDKIEDGATINEAYKAEQLVVTPGKGATATTSYNETTGVATITISSSKDSKTYTVNFAVIPATSRTKTYDVTTVLKDGQSQRRSIPDSYVFTLATLENDNISFSAYAPTDGTVTAANIALDKEGNFSYTGNLRASLTNELTPVTMYGQVKDGELVAAVVDYVVATTSDTTTIKNLYHETYGITASTSNNYTNDIVVTINGDATTIEDQSVTLADLDNGNISFTLKNFQMPLNGSTSYIGNIFLENLPIDADGNFAFNGGILIGPGASTVSKTWGGLDLGIVPLNLRGQRYNNGDDIIVVIDIDMQASIGQTIHVTLGADAVSTTTYNDEMKIAINGEETTVPDTKVVVGTLKNGNINFTLTDFTMQVNGETSYIGNIAIDNIALDSKGNFTYDGTIRIGKGTDSSKKWGGPELGDVPVVIRGSITDYTVGNSITKDDESYTGSQCAIALDVDMQASLGQTIHVTYGLETVSIKSYTDVLAVTVNGDKTTQNQTITVNTLRNGNINFSIDNFALQINENTKQYIGNISLENLILDDEGHFTYEGSVRIGNGSDPAGADWGGPELGDVPLVVNGQLCTVDGTDYLIFNIDIDMEASLKQTINVTFGATPETEETYTDDLKVTINGEATTQEATVTVGTLKNGYINFTLNNFALDVNGAKSYIGNIAINALEVDEDGKFSYNGKVRIGEGTDPEDASWGGPDLGAIPMEMKGQFYTYDDEEYLLVSIAIDMQDSIGQTIDVLFGGTPIRNVALSDNLKVTINEQENKQTADVTVGVLRNGNINFTLRNFKLALSDGTSNIGNLSIDNLEMDGAGNFSYTGVIRIGNGDDESVTSWGGPDLGDIPVVLTGKFSEAQKKAHVLIDIDMQESLSQIINVEFGADFSSLLLGDVNADGTVNISDVTALVNIILNKSADVNGNADINGDGTTNISDVTNLVNIILNK